MQIFPTQYSTLSATALKHRIADSYRLKVKSCRYLQRGVSDTYIVEAEEGKFIFKIYRDAHRSLEAIQGEIELLEILQKEHARIAGPVKNRAGKSIETFQAAEGTRHGVLTVFAKGKSSTELSDAQLDVLGREMAFNHNITANLRLSHERAGYNEETLVNRPLKNLAVAFAQLPDDYAALVAATKNVQEKLAAFDTGNFSYGYTHFDYFPKNFFFDEKDNITIFDFDFAGSGYLAFDLASLQCHFAIMNFNNRMSREEVIRQMQRVITAYRTVRPLSEEEVKAIPYLTFLFMLFYLEYHWLHYDDWSNTFFGERHMRHFSGLMKTQVEMFEGAY